MIAKLAQYTVFIEYLLVGLDYSIIPVNSENSVYNGSVYLTVL